MGASGHGLMPRNWKCGASGGRYDYQHSPSDLESANSRSAVHEPEARRFACPVARHLLGARPPTDRRRAHPEGVLMTDTAPEEMLAEIRLIEHFADSIREGNYLDQRL